MANGLDSFEVKLGYKMFNRATVFESVNNCVREMGQSRYLHLDKRENKAGCKLYRTTAFYTFGICELTIKDYNHKGNAGSELIARCRPAIILYPEDVYALCGETDYKPFQESFNQMVSMINRYMGNEPLPYLDGWIVNRIDYAFQYRTKLHEETMMMLRKSARSVITRSITKARNNGKECRRYDSSVYIVKKKCTVNFYDKTDEKGLQDDFHILRFEVQCRDDYLYKMRNEGRIKDLSLRGLWNHVLALSVVTTQIDKVAGTGDFYSLTKAEKMIKNTTKLTEPETLLLGKMLQYSVQPHVCRETWWEYFEICSGIIKLDSKNPKQRVQRMLRRLRINELAIPLRWHLDELPNPGRVIREMNGVCAKQPFSN